MTETPKYKGRGRELNLNPEPNFNIKKLIPEPDYKAEEVIPEPGNNLEKIVDGVVESFADNWVTAFDQQKKHEIDQHCVTYIASMFGDQERIQKMVLYYNQLKEEYSKKRAK